MSLKDFYCVGYLESRNLYITSNVAFQGEDLIRESGIPYTIVRPCALTEEPAGADLIFDQGDNITVCTGSTIIMTSQCAFSFPVIHLINLLCHLRERYQGKKLPAFV